MMVELSFLSMVPPEETIALPLWSGVSTPVAPSPQILQVGSDQSQLFAEFLNLKVP
jgi:hypothetical protein